MLLVAVDADVIATVSMPASAVNVPAVTPFSFSDWLSAVPETVEEV